jgi:hypothetical protein
MSIGDGTDPKSLGFLAYLVRGVMLFFQGGMGYADPRYPGELDHFVRGLNWSFVSNMLVSSKYHERN